ncbi:2-dehydro-3-deoxy-6-phosphogalactonate aldolase [Hydrogenophaga pseudoflava]|jgi:2-dehydro-3-deoxyphosphogalactonate aldolase|uniref:2-dehydro-3-deoxy-6-phosphogalactonate aldolase n=1 Tax=Hydrogenophaga pseudoflava TaxID=47421 RepID=UPI0008268080|nr:2-dehydro-3-deoxy-6-phosphogalactonate aldolase [Hydrogenophaga pseudoflava]
MNPSSLFRQTLSTHGLIAILRGLRPDEARDIGLALHGAGIRLIEVPLNSPDPLQSIRILREALPDDTLVGAGTVLQPEACAQIAAAGGQLVVMPHSDPAVIRAAKSLGLACAPGVATPTEAFAALAAGADVLKMFPAETLGPMGLKAWRAVLTPPVAIVPVGGITPDALAPYLAAGASGFGLGSALYRAGDDAATVAQRATAFVRAWQQATAAV